MVNKQHNLTARATKKRRFLKKNRYSRRKEVIATRAEINEKRNEGNNSKVNKTKS